MNEDAKAMTADPGPVATIEPGEGAPILSVAGLSLTLPQPGWRRRGAMLPVLTECDLTAPAGQITGVVGASGAGKSLLALAILGLVPRGAVVTGTMRYRGTPLDSAAQARLRGRRIAYLPQGVTALDPTARSDRQVLWAAHRAGYTNGTATRLAGAAMDGQGILAGDRGRFPHELSGGMVRRVLGSMATVGGADLILADEPTTGLDPVARDQSLAALRRLADEGRAVIVISHDLAALAAHADRIAVMREGRILETVTAARLAAGAAHHAYARALWAALPENGLSAFEDRLADAAD